MLSSSVPIYVTYGPYGARQGYSQRLEDDWILGNGIYNVHFDYGLTLMFSWIQVFISCFCLILGRYVKDNILKLGGVQSMWELRSVLERVKNAKYAQRLPKKFLRASNRGASKIPKDVEMRNLFISDEQKRKNPFLAIFPGEFRSRWGKRTPCRYHTILDEGCQWAKPFRRVTQ